MQCKFLTTGFSRQVAAAAMMVFLSLNAPAATTPKKKSATKPAGSSTDVLKKFDTSLTSLPAGFTGSSIRAAWRTFRVRPKGEFETTAEYKARFDRLPWGIYAFVLPKRTVDLTYDADAGSLSVTIDGTNVGIGYDTSDEVAIELLHTNEKREKYVGSNAFGASVVVSKQTYDSYSIITGLESLPSFSVDIDRSRAATLKDRLRILAVVGLGPESVLETGWEHLGDATGFRHFKATFDDPEEVSIFDYSLRGQLLELWLFDQTSGQVIRRVGPDGSTEDSAERSE